MISIKLEGAEELLKLLKSQKKSANELKSIKIVISNDVPYAFDLEFGSVPGQEPWPEVGDKTTLKVDIYNNDTRIVSISGFAMLRSNEEKGKQALNEELQKIKLDEDIKTQLVKAMDKAGVIWLNGARLSTPVEDGNAQAGWKHEVLFN